MKKKMCKLLNIKSLFFLLKIDVINYNRYEKHDDVCAQPSVIIFGGYSSYFNSIFQQNSQADRAKLRRVSIYFV